MTKEIRSQWRWYVHAKSQRMQGITHIYQAE